MTAVLSLPIIDRPIDNTALALYQSCPRKYDFAMRRHRRKSGAPTPAIAYGSIWHKIMEFHYKSNGALLEDTELYVQLATHWEPHGKADDHRTFERAWLEYGNYVKRWGMPEQEGAKTVGWPDSPAIEISANVSWPGAAHPYAGKIDRIIELNGQYFVEDHKTTSRMGNYYFSQFELSNQMMGYVWIAKMLVPSIQIAGVRINAHCVLKKEGKFERQIISYSKDRLDEWAENYNNVVARLTKDYETNNFPGHYTNCDGKYGMCTYSEVCSMPPRLRERVLEADFDHNPWNPLEVSDPAEEGEAYG